MQPPPAVKRAGIKEYLDIFGNSRQPRFSLHIKDLGYCYVCGHSDGSDFKEIINEALASEWELTPRLRKYFDIRESTLCRYCKSSLRSNLHARAICELLAPTANYLAKAVDTDAFRSLRIAEINACGALHAYLAKLPKLLYSEYMPADKNIRHEDLGSLSYQTSSIDVILTSETLEHVPDWKSALAEIKRVLKPGGLHIFTVPAILTRMTRPRTVIVRNREKDLLPKSFHGCSHGITSNDYVVRTEFGADFRRSVDKIGFKTKLYYPNFLRLSDPNFVFVSKKV